MGFLTPLRNSPSVAHPLSQPCGLGSTASISRLNCAAFTASPFPSLLSQAGISYPCTGKAKLLCEAVRQTGHCLPCLPCQTDPMAPPGCPCVAKGPPPRTPRAPHWSSFLHKIEKLRCKGFSRKGVSPERPHKPEEPPQPRRRPPSSLAIGSTAERGFSQGFESREKRRRTWD